MYSIDSLADFAEQNGCKLTLGAPMTEYTSFHIGGPAQALLEPASTDQLAAILGFCNEHEIPVLPLGRGSNVLVLDNGIKGAVLRFGKEFSAIRMIGETEIECEAGATLAQLCNFARENSLSGLEFAYGIPGSVGGAVFMNAGAYGGEMKNVVMSAHHMDISGAEGDFSAEQLDFSYRHSVYSGGGYFITKARFSLTKAEKTAVEARMEELLGRRFDKQPMDMPSAGSTFKRPEGAYASALIDQCGLKGYRVGGAEVSTKHAGFVVNAGGACAQDVLKLMGAVRERVLKETGFLLEPEVEILGE